MNSLVQISAGLLTSLLQEENTADALREILSMQTDERLNLLQRGPQLRRAVVGIIDSTGYGHSVKKLAVEVVKSAPSAFDLDLEQLNTALRKLPAYETLNFSLSQCIREVTGAKSKCDADEQRRLGDILNSFGEHVIQASSHLLRDIKKNLPNYTLESDIFTSAEFVDLISGLIGDSKTPSDVDNFMGYKILSGHGEYAQVHQITKIIIDRLVGCNAEVLFWERDRAPFAGYFRETYLAARQMLDRNVGCMFAGPSVVRGELAFAPCTKNNVADNVRGAEGYFADKPKLKVLYIIADPADELTEPYSWEIYTELVVGSWRRLQAGGEDVFNRIIQPKGSFRAGILCHSAVTEPFLRFLLELPEYRQLRNLAAHCPFFLDPGVVVNSEGSEAPNFDRFILFAMSPAHRVGSALAPRYGPQGVVVTRESDVKKVTDDQNFRLAAWMLEKVPFLYAVGYWVAPDGYQPRDLAEFHGRLFPAIDAHIKQRFPEIFDPLYSWTKKLLNVIRH